MGTPDLVGAAAPTSTVGSFIAVRIPQSISLGGRSRIPHQKWCNKRFGEENPPVPGKSWSSHSSSFGCGARLHLPASFCTIPHTRVGSLLALPTPHPYPSTLHPHLPPPLPPPPQLPFPWRQVLSTLLKDRNVENLGSGGAVEQREQSTSPGARHTGELPPPESPAMGGPTAPGPGAFSVEREIEAQSEAQH